jgi:hypothetical protein
MIAEGKGPHCAVGDERPLADAENRCGRRSEKPEIGVEVQIDTHTADFAHCWPAPKTSSPDGRSSGPLRLSCTAASLHAYEFS